MKKQKINKKRIFVAFGLGVTLGSLFITPMNTANACAIEQPSGVSFSKSYGDLRVIHNRLVDEDIIGYNYNSLYIFIIMMVDGNLMKIVVFLLLDHIRTNSIVI